MLESQGKISHKVVSEYDRASKGKHLPEHAKKKARNRHGIGY